MIKDINRINKWPGYIPPEQDELLSSWMIRLIRAHYTRPFTFSEHYFNGYNILARDTDKYLPEEIIKSISDKSYLSIRDIKQLQLIRYEGIVYENYLEPNFTIGITNVGVYHRTKRHNGLLVCGKCLSKKVYFKKQWRLLSSIICTECNSYLADHCPDCKSPIDFQRHAIGRQNDYINSPLYLCWNCRYDYREIYLPVTNTKHMKYQLYIDKTIHNGYNRHTQYSFEYFKVLFLFLQKFKTTEGTWARVHQALIKEFKIDNEIILELDYKTYQLSPLKLRITILPLIYFLLENWPNRFVRFVKKYRIRCSDFSKDFKHPNQLPFWFQKTFNEF